MWRDRKEKRRAREWRGEGEEGEGRGTRDEVGEKRTGKECEVVRQN